MRNEIVKINHVKRFNQMNPVASPEYFVNRLPDKRIHMDWINRLDIRIFIQDSSNRTEQTMHRLTKILPAVGSNKNEPVTGCPIKLGMGIIPLQWFSEH